MARFSRTTLAAALAAGIFGYAVGAAGTLAPAHAQSPSPETAPSSARWEYRAFNILEFQVQGDKIEGDDWIKSSHLDQPFKKMGDALLKDRAFMSRTLNALAQEGWEPVTIFASVIVARRPTGAK